MKIKKRKKSGRQRGNTTYGHGARKKWKKSGHRGGCGMAGTGKRADQKKSWIIKKYGTEYFGKQGITSRKTAKRVNKIINLKDIENNFDSLMKKFGQGGVLDLSDFKLLGEGELSKKVSLKVREASESAVEKIKKIGGEIEVLKPKQDKVSGKVGERVKASSLGSADVNSKEDKIKEVE